MLCVVLLVALFTPGAARAACSNPAANAGEMRYNSTWRDVQYCNGTIWVQAGLAQYNPVAVTFDGTNDYLTRGADLSSNGDGNTATGSFWVRRNNTLRGIIYSNTTARFEFGISSTNKVTLLGKGTTGTTILDATSNTTITDNNWHHVMFSFDLANSANRSIYIDGVADSTTWTTYTNANIDFTRSNHSIGADTAGGNKFNGDLADFWLELRAYTDLSSAANRAKFLTSPGKPVYLGATGSTPTGAAPDMFFSGALSNWETNDGTGGGFTLNGALTASAKNVIEAGYSGGTGPPVLAGHDGEDGTSIAIGPSAHSTQIYTFTAAASGTADQLVMYVASSPPTDARVGVYDASDNLLTQGTLNNVTTTGEHVFTLNSPISITAGNDYSLAIQLDNFMWIATDSGAGSQWTRNKGGAGFGYSDSGGLPNPFYTGAGTSFNNTWHVFIRNSTDKRDCANPYGAQGQLMYNSTSNVMQFCEGRNWKPMGPVPGSGGGGCANPSGIKGSSMYNSTSNVMQYCDGTKWVPLGGGKISDIPSTGLVGWWKLDESGNTSTAADSVGTNTGTLTNFPADPSANWVAGKMNNALTFDGTNDYVEAADAASLRLNGSWTVSSWINPSALPGASDLDEILVKGIGGNMYDVNYELVLDNGLFGAGVGWVVLMDPAAPNKTDHAAKYTVTPTTGTWYHVAGVWDSSAENIYLYLNGALVATHNCPGCVPDNGSGSPLRIGSKSASAFAFNGKIDDVRIYNRALSAGEVLRIYQTTGGQ